jgi:hypothetical protein
MQACPECREVCEVTHLEFECSAVDRADDGSGAGAIAICNNLNRYSRSALRPHVVVFACAKTRPFLVLSARHVRAA